MRKRLHPSFTPPNLVLTLSCARLSQVRLRRSPHSSTKRCVSYKRSATGTRPRPISKSRSARRLRMPSCMEIEKTQRSVFMCGAVATLMEKSGSRSKIREGFDSRAIPDPTLPENILSAHGRGIYLIRALMDEVQFEEGGTVLKMSKKSKFRMNAEKKSE
jgi:hypothetical protein